MVPDNVFFRADASLEIGSGHVMRCLALAVALEKKGIKIFFLSRPHEGNLISFVRDKGFSVVELGLPKENTPTTNGYEQWLGASSRADAMESLELLADIQGTVWMVTDHYGIGDSWEKAIRKRVDKVVSLDDLANRKHDCDVLIDSSFERKAADYEGLVAEGTRILTGTKYCLLRSEFGQTRQKAVQRTFELPLNRILVTLGGVDIHNITKLVISELDQSNIPDNTHLDVVIGPASPHADALQTRANQSRLRVDINQGVNNMAERLMLADLCIGAVGSSVWERCCLGCPSLVATIAANQAEGTRKLESSGVVVSFSPLVPGELKRVVDAIDVPTLKMLSVNGFSLVDGLGTERIVRVLLGQE
ncbi:UDP-2,4-diacetamido-2,4,6-trideoxy-beta-L-altropyranose hydrolase [Idiomarina fontislapidosi]|uniref:UDP-2,4-diacetamido-2,4, 6-trideoxy-beta-L-altropyranose hydrolase n=1 Tax=Idiomarina fontislapidosi TaxID=263723 RepID=A0A432XYI2_9GAMM|nr:UDP-2,4-diacetamido-2,4,6-trideoxy-beta-L-altropyranose hydrolase [Idiomarina fontislapidosi]PYE32757.1 UDP-2,4-diacetamido-2,4,6-trideoxy-beta-L-altropyranose hydrolase [Idiomarina fontislapidosi]RUO53802.1 UDP-2,4-diacetamido-2,4,6-trideoxy-beta-L-altropyranose hydrolase [Idiomarina fontislapidosi]